MRMKKTPLLINTIKSYKYNSIFFKYFKMFLGVILVPTTIVMIICISLFYKNTSARVERSFENSFMYVENAFSGILEETGKIYQSLLAEPSLQNFMELDSILNMNPINKRNFLNNYNFVSSYTASTKYIESISIYSKKCGYIFDPDGNNFEHNLKHLPWLKNHNEDIYCQFIPIDSNKNEFYICYNYLSNNSSVGLITFKINMSDIQSYIDNIYPDKAGIILTDSKGNIFFEINKDKITPSIKNIKPQTITHSKNTISLKKDIEGNTLIAMANDSVFAMSEFLFSLFSCIFLSVLIALLLALALSFRAHSIINDMIMKINAVEHNNPSNSTATDEIIYLTTNIINIIDRNKALENELLSSITSLNNMQLQMLQIQFSPHFLFNVLNTLHMYLLENYGMNNKISNIILPLCDMLTDSLNTKMYIVTIEDEINYTKKYLELQNIISDNNFRVNWDIDSNTLPLHCVKLTLQPLVENAIKHGIKPLMNTSEKGSIDIFIHKKSDTVEFSITNDGPMVDQAEFVKLQQSLDDGDFPTNKNIGLKNVNKRIQLIYGKEYGCKISNDGYKTTVKIIIPIIENI